MIHDAEVERKSADSIEVAHNPSIDTSRHSSIGLVKQAPGAVDRGTNFVLALRRPSTHNARMADNHVFTINVARDVERPDRYRWSVSENMRLRDKSLHSFATKREAQADADKFVQRLNSIWGPRRGL